MLSKEEYKRALENMHSQVDIETQWYSYDILKKLIDEHFEPKENTSEFKHFKLHSDNTLKNLTKKELIDYINMLYHNWGVCDEQLAHSLNAYNNLEEKYKSIDFTLDKQFEHIEEIEKILDVCGIVAIKKRVKELTNIKPYKFEDYGYRKLKKYGVHDIRRGKLIYIGFLRDIKEEFFEDKYTLEHIKKVTYSNKLLENRYLIRKDIA